MTSSIYLTRKNLKDIQDLMESFGDHNTVLITCDNSSGIGSVITATLEGVIVNLQRVNLVKTIVDESDW